MGNSKASKAKNEATDEPKSTLVLNPVPMTGVAGGHVEGGVQGRTSVENVDADRNAGAYSRHAEQSDVYGSGADTGRAEQGYDVGAALQNNRLLAVQGPIREVGAGTRYSGSGYTTENRLMDETEPEMPDMQSSK